LQPPACADCCCNLQLALAVAPFCQTGGEPPTRIGWSTLRLHRFRFTQLALNVSTSGWAFDAPLTSTEPCIARKAADEYSLSAGSRNLRICQLNNFRLASLLYLLVRPAIPLGLSPQVSTSGWAGGDFPTLIGFSFHQPFRQPTPDAPQAHQL